jgi:hypothetical protein
MHYLPSPASFAPALPYLHQAGSSMVLTRFKRKDEIAQQGLNVAITSIAQMLMLDLVREEIGDLFTLLGKTSPISSSIIYIVPLLQIAKGLLQRKEGIAPRSVRWLCNNIGTISLTASLATNVALFYLGFHGRAAISLSIIAFDYLRSAGYLSERVRSVYAQAAPWIGLSSLILQGKWIKANFVAIDLLSLHRARHEIRLPYDSTPHPSHLTWEQFSDDRDLAARRACRNTPWERLTKTCKKNEWPDVMSCIERRLQQEPSLHYTVDREHVKIAPFPTVGKPNFDGLIQLCDGYQWQDSDYPKLEKLMDGNQEQGLDGDARWANLWFENSSVAVEKRKRILPAAVQARIEPALISHGAALEKFTMSSEELIECRLNYLRDNLRILITQVRDRTIPTSETLDYGILDQYLGYIAQELPKAPREVQVKLLFQLGIEGGDYCGAKTYQQLETVATALMREMGPAQVGPVDAHTRLPLHQRMLIILQQERQRVMEGFHLWTRPINIIPHYLYGGINNTGDLHAYNHSVSLFGTNFGLPDQGAHHDEAASANIIMKLYLKYLHTGFTADSLWQRVTYHEMREPFIGYVPERIMDTVKGQIGGNLLTLPEISQWANEWAERQRERIEAGPLEQAEKDRLVAEIEEFQEDVINGKYTLSNLKPHSLIIEAMLVDMGILLPKPY